VGLMTRLRGALLSETRAIAAGEAAGLTLVARGADPDFLRGTYEVPIQRAIAGALAPGDCFYDIGANIGFFSLVAARRVGADGQVYAFEPVPDNAAAIAESARLNGLATITVFAEAVGASPGREELTLTQHIGGAALASIPPPPDCMGRIEVDVIRLDDAIAARGLRPPSLVKIDVEGAEAAVLTGMADTLRRHRPALVYEVDDATRAGLDRKAQVLAEIVTSAGYELQPLPEAYAITDWHVAHVMARPAAGGPARRA
jgi:FkbM family methyltransferase